MTTIPTFVKSSPAGIEPAFGYISNGGDRHACLLACLAMVANTTFEDVFQQAEALGLPHTGPYWHWFDGDFMAYLGARYGWIFLPWEKVTTIDRLPELCLALVDYDENRKSGRSVIIHRAAVAHTGQKVHYLIDPSAVDPTMEIRTDLQILELGWYMEIRALTS